LSKTEATRNLNPLLVEKGYPKLHRRSLTGCLHDLADVQQTFSKRIQNVYANAGRLLDRANTL